MKTLLVSATTLEVASTIKNLYPAAEIEEGPGKPGTLFLGETIDCLISGVGQMQSGVQISRQLQRDSYGYAVQAGLAGSFYPALPKRSVVVVSEEALADLGAEDLEGFLDLFNMGLMERDEPPFAGGCLRAPVCELASLHQLPRARSVTVNRVLSHPSSIEWVRQRYDPEIVNMEGAAFLYACLLNGIPCVSLRSISDFVGPRDKSMWDIPGAVTALNVVVSSVLKELESLS